MKVAIVIAVEKYANTQIGPVQFAEANATAFSAVLEQHGYAAIDRIVLINDQATKTSIESRLKRTLKGLTEEDDLILFYAGHVFSNGETNFITCYDTTPDDLIDTSVAVNWLFKQFKSSDCQKLSFFLDPCGNGLPLTDDRRDRFADLNELELATFFGQNKNYVCFVSRKANESSHVSGGLKQGIWIHHIIESLDGKAPSALINEGKLSSRSLQNYLDGAVPRTLAKTFTTKKVQTPWTAGGNGDDFQLADLADLLANRNGNANPFTEQVKNVALLARRTIAVRSLSGFKKGHKEPDRHNSAAAAFITKLSSDEITSDVNAMFDALKKVFGFKRADILATNSGDGAATIVTPFFDYSITVELDPNETTQVIFCRTVDAIKEPDQILSEKFATVFKNVFDTVEFETPSIVDLSALIDRIEDLAIDQIKIEYDPDVTFCNLRVEGVLGTITVRPNSLAIVHRKPDTPKQLLESFFQLQKMMVEQHDIRLIHFDHSKHTGRA